MVTTFWKLDGSLKLTPSTAQSSDEARAEMESFGFVTDGAYKGVAPVFVCQSAGCPTGDANFVTVEEGFSKHALFLAGQAGYHEYDHLTDLVARATLDRPVPFPGWPSDPNGPEPGWPERKWPWPWPWPGGGPRPGFPPPMPGGPRPEPEGPRDPEPPVPPRLPGDPRPEPEGPPIFRPTLPGGPRPLPEGPETPFPWSRNALALVSPAGSRSLGRGVYHAFRYAGVITLVASGMAPTLQTKAALVQLPIKIFPPRFALYFSQPPVTLPAQRPFVAEAHFAASEPLSSLQVLDADGLHAVTVAEMPDGADGAVGELEGRLMMAKTKKGPDLGGITDGDVGMEATRAVRKAVEDQSHFKADAGRKLGGGGASYGFTPPVIVGLAGAAIATMKTSQVLAPVAARFWLPGDFAGSAYEDQTYPDLATALADIVWEQLNT